MHEQARGSAGQALIPLGVAGLAAALFIGAALPAAAEPAGQAPAIEEVVVTGSRIRRDAVNQPTAILELDRDELDRTGLTNLGEALQNLPIAGSAPNSQFNVPGNSGFPQDGSGIGAGSVQLSLRNLGANRTLVLVDGRRWVAGASASGVPGTVDLNSIPDNAIERIEILQDGASAVYGSDAIGGVVNIVTDRDFSGLRFDAQTGGYLEHGDGESTALGAKWGAGNGVTHAVLSAILARRTRHRDRGPQAFGVPEPGRHELRRSGLVLFVVYAAGPFRAGSGVRLREPYAERRGAERRWRQHSRIRSRESRRR